MGKNVLIPRLLVVQIIELLEYWDISSYDRSIRDDYCRILRDLNVKLRKLELRDAYSGIIHAKNEDARHDARIEYLRLKSHIANDCADNYDL